MPGFSFALAQEVAVSTERVAPLLQNLGRHTFPVTTNSGRAQPFINQGLNLSFAFNHADADFNPNKLVTLAVASCSPAAK